MARVLDMYNVGSKPVVVLYDDRIEVLEDCTKRVLPLADLIAYQRTTLLPRRLDRIAMTVALPERGGYGCFTVALAPYEAEAFARRLQFLLALK